MKAMKIIEISPLVRKITADNGGVFTGAGTNTYLVGHQEITVIDPGPASQKQRHEVTYVIKDSGILKRSSDARMVYS